MRPALRGGYLVNEESVAKKPFKLRVGDPLPKPRSALPAPDDILAPSTATGTTLQQPVENPHNEEESRYCSGDTDQMQQRNGDERVLQVLRRCCTGQCNRHFRIMSRKTTPSRRGDAVLQAGRHGLVRRLERGGHPVTVAALLAELDARCAAPWGL